MTKDAIYEATREIKTFADLAHAARVLMYKTKQEPKGSYYTTLGALLLITFTFEAYLNHLGEKKIKFWEEIERIEWKKKYTILCKEFDLVPDYSKRPYQTLKPLFKFRNAIVHGKSEILKDGPKEISSKEVEEITSNHDSRDYGLKAEWEAYCTLENAERAQEDISKIITELHKKAGYVDDPFAFGKLGRGIHLKSSYKKPL